MINQQNHNDQVFLNTKLQNLANLNKKLRKVKRISSTLGFLSFATLAIMLILLFFKVAIATNFFIGFGSICASSLVTNLVSSWIEVANSFKYNKIIEKINSQENSSQSRPNSPSITSDFIYNNQNNLPSSPSLSRSNSIPRLTTPYLNSTANCCSRF